MLHVEPAGLLGSLGLNPEQEQAARHGEGPALVLAGPGTGKTTTLVGRYGFLLEQGVEPARVFVATFTRKAAEQLKGRIAARTGIATGRLPVGTFHSLCLRLLQECSECVGVPPGLRVISEGQQFRLLRDLKLDWPGELEDLKDAIGRFKDRLVSPQQARREAQESRAADREGRVVVAQAYARYEKALRTAGLYDFGDLIALAVRALRQHPDLRARYSERYRFLMVDEFQDINPAQDALLRALLDPTHNLWAVGDDDQAIYGWRGSDVRYLSGFEKTYPGARVHRLVRNYRSPPVVLDVANRLIGHNGGRLAKSLEPTKPTQTQVVLCLAADERREARWVTLAIRTLLAQGMQRAEIAVLLRTNHLTLPFEAELRRAGIPFVIRGGKGFWALKEVQTILEALWSRSTEAGSSPCPWVGLPYLQPRLSEAAAAQANTAFPALVRALAEAVAAAPPFSAAEERKLQWAGAARQVAAEARGFEDADAFLEHVQATSTAPADDADVDAVVLSTIHQAKGLEWEAVFVCGCEAGLMPHERAEDGEEERRLAFVAATRAKRYLSISCSETRGDRPVRPSPFVAEMTREVPGSSLSWRRWPEVKGENAAWGVESVGGVSAVPGKPGKKTSLPAAAKGRGRTTRGNLRQVEPAKTIRVFHSAFGQGVLKRVNGDKWTVQFKTCGEKVILAHYLKVLS